MEKEKREGSPIYTIGYGNRPIDSFIGTLKRHAIGFLIDVRTSPYSKYNPVFSKDQLEQRLKSEGIKYVFMGETLGGRPDDDSCYTADGKVDYLKYSEKPFFLEGINRLRTAWEKKLNVALMCSEGKPHECHRSKLIGDVLTKMNVDVIHIDEKDQPKTQEQVISVLTGGQADLFETQFTSRKSYKPVQP